MQRFKAVATTPAFPSQFLSLLVKEDCKGRQSLQEYDKHIAERTGILLECFQQA